MVDIGIGTYPEWATSFFTLVGFVVAFFQLQAIKKTDNATFVHELYREFRTDKLGSFIQLFHRNSLKFIESKCENHFADNDGHEISAHDVSVYLLNPLESVGALAARDLVTIDLVYDFFGWYVELAWTNQEIRKYIAWLNESSNHWDVYRRLEVLHDRCKVYCDEERLKHDRGNLPAPGHYFANLSRVLRYRSSHPS
jgi:hypothetical protein